MPQIHRVRKGLNIRMAGTAEKRIGKAGSPETYAVKPTDFHGLVPRLEVSAGTEVKAGSVLFTDKNRPDILFTSPVSGNITAINRGERRSIQEVVIQPGDGITYEDFRTGDPLQMRREEIIENLLRSGLWPAIRQRPYHIIADPQSIPKSIFVPAFDTAPLAPDYQMIVEGNEQEFQVGIDVLSKLTEGSVHISVDAASNPPGVFTEAARAQVHYFSGPHPAGNAGVHIQRIDPINKGEIVWVVAVQDIIAIGRLFTTGHYDPSKIIAFTGSEVIQPQYYKVTGGSCIHELVHGNVKEGNNRYISGNPLTGTKITSQGYLGYYDSQITVLPEGEYYEFLGWSLPGLNKFSISRTFWSWLSPNREYVIDTNLRGGNRAFVITGLYEKVFPMDIYPMQLLKAIIAEDIDQMERLGIYEVAEEDFALCEFIDPSKTEMQDLVRKGLDMIKREMS